MSDDRSIDPYYQSGEAAVEHKDIDAAGDSHPFGDEPKEWQADLRQVIRQVADDLYETWEATLREYLANGETACLKVERHLEDPERSPFDDMIVRDGYEPAIEVTWDKKEQKVIIKDNGIGMAAAEVDQVFRYIGRSAARDLGAMSGTFGFGVLSFPKFIGPDNMMVMLSHSRLNDDNAAYLVTLAGVEPARGSLGDDEYGTKFKLDQKDADMNVRRAVERYAQWMRVPVMYRELDENGEEVFNEDWGDKALFDTYDDSSFADWISVENGFQAYMSEDADGTTLLLSMEIDRNGGDSYKAPYPFDVRILDESGRVIESSNGNEGLIPVSRIEYEQMLLNARSDYITRDLLSNQDVTAFEVSGEADYAIEDSYLESDETLPMGEYVPFSEIESDDVEREIVLMGKHKGREVVSESEWNDLPEGRASKFVVEEDLEEYDLDSGEGEGDLTLPKPTTDRSSLQEHDKFWKYISQRFLQRYDNRIEEYREVLRTADDEREKIEELDAQTTRQLKTEVTHAR